MVDLGSAHGSMTIDASQAISSVRSVMSELQALSAMKVNIGAFDAIQSGAKDAAGALKSLSGTKVEIDTSDAVGGLTELRSAAEDTFASMAADSPKVSVDTSEAVGNMNSLQSAVQDAMAAITSNAGSVNIDVSGALGQISQLMTDAQDLGSIFAGAALKVNIDTSAAQGDLLALAVSIDDIAAAMTKLNGISVQLDTSGAQGALQSLMADVDDLAASVSGNAMSLNIDTAGASSAINDLATELALTQQIAALPMSVNVQVNSGQLQDLQAQAQNAKAAVESVGESAPNISFGQAISDLNQMAVQLGAIQGMMSGLGRFSLGAGLIGALLSPMVIGISYAAKLEQGLKNVSVALGGLGNSDLSRLNSEIIKIGTNTQFSAKEIADVAQNLAKAGYDVSDMIDGKMLPAVAALASATGDSLQTATMGIVQAMSLWSPAIADTSIALTDASRAADVLTVAANSSMASVEDIIRGIRNLGPIAVQMGVSFEDAAAAIAVFTNYGLKGADAGVSLARGLQNLQQPTSEASQLMDDLGIKLFDLQGKFIGMPQLFGQLSNALRGATQEQKLNAISTLFGAEAMDAYAIAIAAGKDPLVEIVNQMQANDIAMGQATERTQTFLGAIERLGETTQTALGYMSQPFIGPLTFLANTMTAIGQTFAALPQPITGAIGALTGIAGTIAATAIAASTLRTAFSGIGNILGSAPGIAQGIAGFKKLTAAIQGSAKAMAVLSFATGPIGLSIGALALGIGALWLLARKQDQDAKQSQEAYQAALKQTNQLITDKLVSGQTKLATAMQDTAQAGRTAMTTVETRMTSFGNQWNDMWTNFAKTGGDYSAFDGFFQTPFGDVLARWVQNADTDTVSSYIKEGVQDAFDNGVSATNLDAVKSARNLYFDAFMPTADDKAMLEGHLQDFFKVLENPNIDMGKAQEGFNKILTEYMNSDTPDPVWLDKALTDYIAYLNSAQGQADLALKKMTGLNQAAQEFQFTLAGLRTNGLTTVADQLERANSLMPDLTGKLQEADMATFNAAQQKANALIQAGGADVDEYNKQLAALSAAYNSGAIDAATFAQGYQGLTIWLANTVKQVEQLGDAWQEMAAGMRLDKNFEGADQVEQFTKNYAQLWSELTAPADKQLMDKDLNTIFQLLASGKVDVDKMTGAVMELNRQYSNGQITAEQWLFGLHQIVLNQDDYALSTAKAAGAQAKLNTELAAGAAITATYAAAMAKYNPEKNAKSIGKEMEAAQKHAEAMKALGDSAKDVVQSWADFNEANFGNFADMLGLDPRVLAYSMTDFATQTAKAGIAMQSIQSTYSNIYRIVVSNTDSVSQLATTTQEWADNLIAAEGTEGKIDDLLARKVINQQQYNDAQKAYNSIAEDTAKIQDYTLKIQTMQAPLIAAQTDALEKQYAVIANMPAEQQLVALGWMDSAESAKALEINAMAAGVAAGQGGESGRIGFEKMLDSIVATDPALALMLEQMGLIELSADKQHIIKINYDNAEGAESEISRLTRSIDMLTIALGGIPPFDINTFPFLDAAQKAAVLRNELERLKQAGKMPEIMAALGKAFGAKDGSGESPMATAAGDAKTLAAALSALAQGQPIPDAVGANAERVANALKQMGEQGDIEKKVRIDFENPEVMDKLKAMAEAAKQQLDVRTKFSQTGNTEVSASLEKLKEFQGRVIEVSTKFKTEGDAPDFSNFERGGPKIPPITIPTVFEPPRPNQFNPSKPEPVHVPTQFDPPASGPTIPTPEPVKVPIIYDTSAVSDDVRSPTGIDGPFSKGAATGLTIPVTFTVTGADQVSNLINTITNAKSTTVTTTVAVNGAELIGALKLDIQNLSNKTLTIMIAVNGAELIGALKLDIQNLSNKTVTISGDATDALLDIQAVLNLMTQITSKAVSISTDNTDAVTDIDTVVTKMKDITSKAVSITTDNTDAISDIDAVKTGVSEIQDKTLTILGDATLALAAVDNTNIATVDGKTLVIAGDNSGAMGAYNELAGLTDITKTMTINIQVNGKVPAGFAKGGTTDDAVVRAGERGAEAFRTPRGTTGILPTDSLYSLPVGTRIFTASQTRRMMSDMKGMFPAFARGGVVGSPVNTAVMQSAYEKSVYRQLNVILKEIRDYGGDALKDTAKSVEDMMKDLSKATSDAVSGVMNELKDFGWPAPKTTALMNQTQTQQTKEANAQAGSAWQRLDAIATEIEKYGGSSMESIAKAARDMQRGGPITEEAVSKMVKDLQDKGWAGTKTAALAKLLKETASSLTDASALFSDETWDRRIKKMSNPNDVKDLFTDRTRRNGRDFTLDNGKVLEHYGGGQPPSGVGQAPKAGDTFVIQSLTPETFAEVLDGAQDGRITQTTIARARAAYTTRGIVTPVKG